MDKALRDNANKPELSYVLDFEHGLIALSRVCESGARKYARNNWKKGGKPDQEYIDAAMRHLLRLQGGEELDRDAGTFHAAHVAWNMLALLRNNRTEEECYEAGISSESLHP